MSKRCKPENQNQRMGQFVKGFSAKGKRQPNNHIPNQRKTRKVVV